MRILASVAVIRRQGGKMANRTFNQFTYSFHKMPVVLDCNFLVGSTGAVGTTKGPGITAITRLAVGIYQIQLQDNYFKYFLGDWQFAAPVTGADVASTALVTGTAYQITAVGTTNWQTAGLPVGLTAAVGQSFVAVGTATGTGTAKAIGTSGIFAIENLSNPNLSLAPSNPNGAYIHIKCLNASGAATDPAAGSTLFLGFYLSNSSVIFQGE